jgi:hypothetical protein
MVQEPCGRGRGGDGQGKVIEKTLSNIQEKGLTNCISTNIFQFLGPTARPHMTILSVQTSILYSVQSWLSRIGLRRNKAESGEHEDLSQDRTSNTPHLQGLFQTCGSPFLRLLEGQHL